MDDQPERLGHVRGLNRSGSGLVCGDDAEQLPAIRHLRTLYRGFALAHEIIACRIQWDFLAAVVEVFRHQFVIRAVVVAFEQLPPIGQLHFAQLLDEVGEGGQVAVLHVHFLRNPIFRMRFQLFFQILDMWASSSAIFPSFSFSSTSFGLMFHLSCVSRYCWNSVSFSMFDKCRGCSDENGSFRSKYSIRFCTMCHTWERKSFSVPRPVDRK